LGQLPKAEAAKDLSSAWLAQEDLFGTMAAALKLKKVKFEPGGTSSYSRAQAF